MPPLVNFHKNITYLRKLNGLTQKDLSELLGVERSTYAKYETGSIRPPLSVFCKLCYIYKISPEILLELDHDAITPSNQYRKKLSNDPDVLKKLEEGRRFYRENTISVKKAHKEAKPEDTGKKGE